MKTAISIVLLVAAAAALVTAIVIPARIGHPVTSVMSTSADAAAGHAVRPLPGITAPPLMVVVFILPGCPCSEAYESYTQELVHAYGTQVTIVGVVDGTQADTDEWGRQHQTPFPLIADVDCSIAKDYQANRSAYTALVTDGQTISRLWPGYSAGMLHELSALLAADTKVADPQPAFANAPEALTSGCMLNFE